MQSLLGKSKGSSAASNNYFLNGRKAFEEQNYRGALSNFRIGAETYKDSKCCYWLGAMYFAGLGTEKDYDMSIPWLKKSAKYNDFFASPLFILGNIYLLGELGIDNNGSYEKASINFNKAGEIDPVYYVYAGDIFFTGDNGKIDLDNATSFMHSTVKFYGKLIDYKKALHWYLKADQKGVEGMYLKISKIYHEGGHGIERDLSAALIWCQKDINLGNKHSWTLVGRIYCEGGYGVRRDYGKAIECLKKGDYVSYLRLGEVYQYFLNPPDYKRAHFWYRKSIEKGDGCHIVAHDRLGWLYLKGLGTEKNYCMAKQHFGDFNGYAATLHHLGLGVPINYELALTKYLVGTGYNSGNAFNGIGLLYLNGLGVPQDFVTAMNCFRKAVSLNNLAACNSLGNIYYHGRDEVKADFKEAFYWYSRAAKGKDDNDGQFNLGIMYLEGKGTEVDYTEALFWFKRSRLLGNDRAQNYIDQVERMKKITEAHHKHSSELLFKEKEIQDARLREAERIAEEEKKKVAKLMLQLEQLQSTSTVNLHKNVDQSFSGATMDSPHVQEPKIHKKTSKQTNNTSQNNANSKTMKKVTEEQFPKQFFHLY